MAVAKVTLNGTTLMDTTDATADASKILNTYTAYIGDGSKATGTATGGADAPTFTVTWDDNWESILSVTCDKTFAECDSLIETIGCATVIDNTQSGTNEFIGAASVFVNANSYIDYAVYMSGVYPAYDIRYNSNGTIVATSPTQTYETLDITANGSYYPQGGIITEVNVAVPSTAPTLQAKTNIAPSTSSQTITADSGFDGLSSVQINAMPSGTAGTPTATKGTVSNHSVSVTPSVTNTTGYITGSTKTGTAVTVSASELVSGTLSVTSSGTKDVTNYASASIPSGTEGTPSATKGTVSNHSISVTPSVTNTTGYITGSTKTGTAVTVSASELVSGSETIASNGTHDVTNLASVTVAVPGGGSSMNAQSAQSTTRASSSTYTKCVSLTCSQAGTYDVYWSAFRSSTSGTSGSQLYVGGSAYGTADTTTWTNHIQNKHLTGVSIRANQEVAVYARSRGSNYYSYVGTLTIIQTA